MKCDPEQPSLRGIVDRKVENGPRDRAVHDALHLARLLLEHEHVARAEEGDARRRYEAADDGPHAEVWVDHRRRRVRLRPHPERDEQNGAETT
jgi:hypothetical protein